MFHPHVLQTYTVTFTQFKMMFCSCSPCQRVNPLLPTAQWFPRGYIFPTAAAGLSEQTSMQGTVASMMNTGHTGLQVHEAHRHTPPMLPEGEGQI